MSRTLRAVDGSRKCDLAGDSYAGKRPYAKSMQALTWGRSGRIADALGLSQRTVETWGNPADPQRGPNQSLAIAMHVALDAGAGTEEALAPLIGLAEEFGFDLAPRVPVVTGADLLAQADRLSASALSSAAGAVRGYLDSMTDRRLTPSELQTNRQGIREAVSALLACLDHSERTGRETSA